MKRKRLLSLLLILVLLMSSSNNGFSVIANEIIGQWMGAGSAVDNSIDMEFTFVDVNTEFGDKERPVPYMSTIEFNVTLNPKFTFGEAQWVKVYIDLPYLEFDENEKSYQYSGADDLLVSGGAITAEELPEEPKKDEENPLEQEQGSEHEDNTDNAPDESWDSTVPVSRGGILPAALSVTGEYATTIKDLNENSTVHLNNDSSEEDSVDTKEHEGLGNIPEEGLQEAEEAETDQEEATNQEEAKETENDSEADQEDSVEESGEEPIELPSEEMTEEEEEIISQEQDEMDSLSVPPLTKNNGVQAKAVYYDESWNVDYKDEHKGLLVVERNTLEAGSMPSFSVALEFYGNVPQNAIADIKGWVEYESFDGQVVNWRTEEKYDKGADIRIAYTDLTWSTKVVALEKNTTIWDRLNYVPFDFTITNKSINDTSIVDRFNINLAVPYKGEYFSEQEYIGGMTDLDAYLWRHSSGGPLYNNRLELIDGERYVGHPGEDGILNRGGILVYDITDEPGLSHNILPQSEPLEYTYTGAGLLTVRLKEEKEVLYPLKTAQEDSSKIHERIFRFYLPFDNRFINGKLPHEFNLKIQPTIYIGDKDRFIRWTKDADDKFTLHHPDKKPMTFEKVGFDEPAYYGIKGGYYIQNIHNPSNAPYFDPYIIDTLPADFELSSVRYEVECKDPMASPPLMDHMAESGTLIEYEIVYQDKRENEYTKDYTLDETDLIRKYENEKLIWEFDLKAAISNSCDEIKKAGYYLPKASGYLRINLKNRVESMETIPGKIAITGEFQTGGPLTNEALLYYDFKTHMAPEQYFPDDIAYKPEYRVEPQGPIYDDATVYVIKPGPLMEIKGYHGLTSKEGNQYEVPYDGAGEPSNSGFRYYIGNTTGSPIKPGKLLIQVPVYEPDKVENRRNGLMTKQIVISKELWERAIDTMLGQGIHMIDKIVMTQEDSAASSSVSHTITGSQIYSYAAGNTASDIVIDKSSGLLPDESIMNSPNKIEVYFNTFPQNITNPAKRRFFIAVQGATTRYGELHTEADWLFDHAGGILTSSGTDYINVIKPNPELIVKAFDGDKRIGDKLLVKYDGFDEEGASNGSGFRYYIGNKTASAMEDAEIAIYLPVYEPSGIQIRLNGLLPRKIVISEEFRKYIGDLKLQGVDLIQSIELYDDNHSFIIPGADLESYGSIVGEDLVIEKGSPLWPNNCIVEEPKKILIRMSSFPGNIAQPDKTGVYIDILGRTARYGLLETKADWGCEILHFSKIVRQGSNHLDVIKPEPELVVKAFDGDKRVDDNLLVTYDGFDEKGASIGSGFRYFIGNKTDSVMENAEIAINLPVYEPSGIQIRKNGLLPRKIVISEEFRKYIGDLKLQGVDLIQSIELYDDNYSYLITGADLESYGSIVDGDLVIEKGSALWPNNCIVEEPKKILIRMSNFPGSIAQPDRAGVYIDILGRTARYGLLETKADWSCEILHFSKILKEGSNRLDVIKPEPKVSLYAEYGEYRNSKTIADGQLTDQLMGWVPIPYGRRGTYHYNIFNDSSSAVPKGEVTLDLQVNKHDQVEGGRGFRFKEFIITKKLLLVMKVEKIHIADTEGNHTNILRFPDGGYYFEEHGVTGTGTRLDSTGKLLFTDADSPLLKNVKHITIYYDRIAADLKEDDERSVVLSGYIDNLPYKVYRRSIDNALVEPSKPSNVTEGNITTIINEDEVINSKDKAGFCPMAARIDYSLYSKIGGESGYEETTTTLFNEYEYEYHRDNIYYKENVSMDVGYKSIGSFVSGIEQFQRYDANVKMTLDVEFRLPYNDFELYYIRLHPSIRNYLDADEGVKIYRRNSSGGEELWYTVKGSEWKNNSNDLKGNPGTNEEPWFRINTLLPSNNQLVLPGGTENHMFSTLAVDTLDENQVHPYYRSPRQTINLSEQVSRVVFRININQQDLDGSGKAKLPDLNIADNLFHLTGRFYKHAGSTYAESEITYHFGEDKSLRANMRPHDVLVGSVRTIDNMLHTYMHNPNMSGDRNRFGTSFTKAHFNIHEPIAEVRKGVKNNANILPNNVTLVPETYTTFPAAQEPLLGDTTKFLLTFWNGKDAVKPSGNNRVNEWSGKKIFADEVSLIDTLPPVRVIHGEDKPYEGFIPSMIRYTKTDTIEYSYRKHFVSLKLETDKNRTLLLTLNDFDPSDPIQVNFIYPDQGIASTGLPGIDVLLYTNEFLKSYTFTVKNLHGHGDISSEFIGVSEETEYSTDLIASLDVEGQILSKSYEINQVDTSVALLSNGRGTSTLTVTDYAKIRGLAPVLMGNIDITSNISGKNQFVYNPSDRNQPNIMEYYYDIRNPKRVGTSYVPKSGIGKFDLNIQSFPNFQLQQVVIPSEVFEGNTWRVSEFKIGDDELSSQFVKTGTDYVLNVESPLLNRYLTDSSGYRYYNSKGDQIKVVIEVKNPADKSLYLGEDMDLTPDHEIILRGIYAMKPASASVWDENSITAIGKDSWAYSKIFSRADTMTILASYSNTRFTDPPIMSTLDTQYIHEVKNLVSNVDFTIAAGKVYDIHDNKISIEDRDIIQGDRKAVRITMRNAGVKIDDEDGFIELNTPMIRYYVPAGMRIVRWDFVPSESTVDIAEFTCKDVTNTVSPKIMLMGAEYTAHDPLIKDLVWLSSGKLEEEDILTIDMVLEYTSDKAANKPLPNLYQGEKIISANGVMIVSGGMTHGFYPFLYGLRDSQYLPTGYRRGMYTLDPTNPGLMNLTAAMNDDQKEAAMVNTEELRVTVQAKNVYKGLEENISGEEVNVTISKIGNHTKHDNTGVQVEFIFDTGADNLKGLKLLEWPIIPFPTNETCEYGSPLLYYKKGDNSSPWIPVTASLVAKDEDIYSIMWDYGRVPAYHSDGSPFNMDDVVLNAQVFWRSSKPNSDANITYEVKSSAVSWYRHSSHDYTVDRDIIFGKTAKNQYTVYKQIPFIHLDVQVFDRWKDAKANYVPNNPERKQQYRPNEEFWYKITLKNQSRDKFYTNVGTGPLIDPLITDIVPEYIVDASKIAAASGSYSIDDIIKSGDYKIYWYDRDNRLKTFTEPIIHVREFKSYDIGGANKFSDYPNMYSIYGTNVLNQLNAEEITYYAVEYYFQEELQRDERIEIQYKVEARLSNLPQSYYMKDGERYNAFLPRLGEYVSLLETVPNLEVADFITKRPLSEFTMDGDYLIHETGVSGTSNYGTPDRKFLAQSNVWIPGTDTNHGVNGNFADYDMKNAFIQQAEVKINDSGKPSYVNSLYNSGDIVGTMNRDTYELILKPRSQMIENALGYDRNFVWSQNRLHLSKAWIYGSSEMIPRNKNDKYEVDGHTYSYEHYVYAAERGEVFTARQHAINFGDYHTDGLKIIYVLPRGTEPVMIGNKIDMAAYHGDPAGKYEQITDFDYEILQRPDSPATVPFYAPRKLVESQDGGNAERYLDTEYNSKPWVVQINIKVPLSPWWNSSNSVNHAGNGIKANNMFTEINLRVVEENVNEHWYDEVFISAPENHSQYYVQAYSKEYSKAFTLTPILRYVRTHAGRLLQSKENLLLGGETQFIDTDFDGIPNDKIYARSGDKIKAKKPMIRLWTDVGKADTADFYEEARNRPFDLNIHIVNKYEWADNPLDTYISTNYHLNERFYHNHQTDGGLKGTYFEPVLVNILPYGVVPVDTDGNPLPADGAGWVDDGSRMVQFHVNGSDVNGVDVNGVGFKYTEADFDVETEFMERDAYNNPLNRYKLTFKPKDYTNFEDEVKVKYNEHMVITVKSKTVLWPQYTYIDPKTGMEMTDRNMYKRWQENRTFASTKKEVFHFLIEPSGSPYIVGSTKRQKVTDVRPDIQGVSDKIKAKVLGNISIGYEKNSMNIEDYSNRVAIMLTADQRDFNQNGRNSTRTVDDSLVLEDRFVMNTMSLFTKHPRLVVDKSVARNEAALKDEDPLSVSYGNNFWYNINIKNEPAPLTNSLSLDSLMFHESMKGTLQSSNIMFHDWMSDYVSYEDYRIQYPDPSNNGNHVILTPSQAAAAGWEVDLKPQGLYPPHPKFVALTVRTEPYFMNSSSRPIILGDLRTGEEFTLKLKSRVTDTGIMDDKPDIPWGKFANHVYVNAESFSTDADRQPDYFSDYVTFVSESSTTPDYNLDHDKNDEYGTESAYINILKPKGSIRQDTYVTRKEFGSGAIDNPSFRSQDEIVFMIDELNSVRADTPELIIQVNGISKGKYQKQTDSNDWKATLHKVTSGKWEVPSGYNPKDYKIYVYYSMKEVEFEEFGDRSDWIALHSTGIDLDENLVISELEKIPDISKLKRIIYVIKSDDPERNPVPAGIRIDMDADEKAAGKQNVSDVDPKKNNTKGFPQSVYDNTPQITYKALFTSNIICQVYSNVTLWARYNQAMTAMIGKDTAGVNLTPSNPVLDIQNSIEYFRYNGGNRMFQWDKNIVINPTNSKFIKYTVDFNNIEDARAENIFYPEDYLENPVIVDALPSIVTVDPDNFKLAETEEEKEIFDSDYKSSSNLDNNGAKWTWEIIEGKDRSPSYPASKLEFVQFEVTPVTNTNAHRPNELFTRKVARWKFEGIIYPGDTLRLHFLAVVDAVELDETKSSVNDVYGFNASGTLIVYIDPNKEKGNAAIDVDDYDLNDNKKADDRFVTNYSKGIGFVTASDLKKSKRVYTNLDQTGISTINTTPASEGTTYSVQSTMINTMDNYRSYTYPVIFDMLPYPGDKNIIGSIKPGSNNYSASDRNSKWSGWLDPSSIRLEEVGEGAKGIIDPSNYSIWIGPYRMSGGKIELLDSKSLPDLDKRSVMEFYKDMAGSSDTYLRSMNFIRLEELLNVKRTDNNLYESLRKGAIAIYAQMNDRGYKLAGQNSLTLHYDMEIPQNVPILKQEVDDENYKKYGSWGSFAAWTSTLPKPGESNAAGVYVTSPKDKAYIGNYIWLDENGNGLQDETAFEIDTNGRIISKITDSDKDPGINGVVVELVNKDGLPVDENGNGLIKKSGNDSIYYIAGPDGKTPAKDIFDRELQGGTPVSYTSNSDAGNRAGYYILTNIEPGEYRLRFTLPKEYKHYGLTTLKMHGDVAVKGIEPVSSTDSFVVLTDPFSIHEGESDASYMNYDLGLHMPVRYGGTVWIDEHISEVLKGKNGIMDFPWERTLEGAVIQLFTEGGKPAYDLLGRLAKTTSDKDGKFSFHYLTANKKYYIVADYSDKEQGYPTPIVSMNPLENDIDNDLYYSTEGVNRTSVFTAAIPMENGKPIYADSSNNCYAYVDRIGLGFIDNVENMISGIAFADENRNGLLDENERRFDGIEVKLNRYVQYNGSWIVDNTFVPRISETSKEGTYFFEDLDGISIQGYPYGYHVWLDKFPDNSTPAILHEAAEQLNEEKQKRVDSDLYPDGVLYDRNPMENEDGEDRLYVFASLVNGRWMPDTHILTGLNAGFAAFDKGSIQGKITYIPKDTDIEKPAPGIPLTLKAKQLDADEYLPVLKSEEGAALVYGMDGYENAVEEYTILSDEDGSYTFDHLTTAEKSLHIPYVYQVEAKKPTFAEWALLAEGEESLSNTATAKRSYILVEKDENNKYGYNFYDAVDRMDGNFTMSYPKPSILEGTIFEVSNSNNENDGKEALSGRIVRLYSYSVNRQSWIPDTDLHGNHMAISDDKGYYSFLVDSAEFDVRSKHVMEQKRYRLVFDKTANEDFIVDGSVSAAETCDLLEAEKNQLSLSWMSNGVTDEIYFGELSFGDPQYGGRDVVDLSTVESSQNVNCELVILDDGVISGHIWMDLNSDGIQNADEPAAAGRNVFLYENVNGSWVSAVDKNGKSVFVTKEDGRYQFEVDAAEYYDQKHFLEPKEYRAVFEKELKEFFTVPELVQGGSQVYPLETFSFLEGINGNRYCLGSVQQDIILAETFISEEQGKEVIDRTAILNRSIDCGIIPQKNNMISGTIWKDSNRNGVMDEDEHLAAGKTVKIYKKDLATGIWNAYTDYNGKQYATKTNAYGRYEFEVDALNYDYLAEEGLEAGEYRIVFEKDADGEYFTRADRAENPEYGSMAYTKLELEEELSGISLGDLNAVTDVIRVITGSAIHADVSDFINRTFINCGLTEQPIGALHGYFWHDSNSDGIRQMQERTVSDEEVILYKLNKGSGRYEVHQDLNGVDTLRTEADGSYEFLVDVSDNDEDSQYYLEQVKYRILAKTEYGEDYTKEFTGDDDSVYSWGMKVQELTEEQLQVITGVPTEDGYLITDELIFGEMKADKVLGKDRIAFETVKDFNTINFGVLRTEETALHADNNSAQYIILENQIPEEGLPEDMDLDDLKGGQPVLHLTLLRGDFRLRDREIPNSWAMETIYARELLSNDMDTGSATKDLFMNESIEAAKAEEAAASKTDINSESINLTDAVQSDRDSGGISDMDKMPNAYSGFSIADIALFGGLLLGGVTFLILIAKRRKTKMK